MAVPKVFGRQSYSPVIGTLNVIRALTGDVILRGVDYPLRVSDLKQKVERDRHIKATAMRLLVDGEDVDEHEWLETDADVHLIERSPEAQAFLAALKSNHDTSLAFHRNDDWICDDFDCIMAAMRVRGLELEYAAESKKGNPKIVIAAVRNNGMALRFANQLLKDNEEIVTAAVRNNGMALQFATQRLRDNEEIVNAAVRQSSLALQFAAGLARTSYVVRQAVLEETLLGSDPQCEPDCFEVCFDPPPEVIQMLPEGDARKYRLSKLVHDLLHYATKVLLCIITFVLSVAAIRGAKHLLRVQRFSWQVSAPIIAIPFLMIGSFLYGRLYGRMCLIRWTVRCLL